MLMFYIKRIINDKTKLSLLAFIFILPFSEVFIHLKNVLAGRNADMADLYSFLAGNTHGIGHMLQIIYLWFMPLYLLVVVAEDCFEDFNTGYINVLKARRGKIRYYSDNLVKGFVLSFLIVFISLILNFIFVHILFYSSCSNESTELISDGSFFNKWSVKHMSATNIIYIFLTSIIFGITGAAENAMALFFHDRKIVYPIELAVWFGILMCPRSIMLFIQPFTEYDLSYSLLTFIVYIILNIVVSFSLLFIKIKYEKI